VLTGFFPFGTEAFVRLEDSGPRQERRIELPDPVPAQPPVDLGVATDRSEPAASAARIAQHFGLRAQQRWGRFPGAAA
jgi:hypothetical protein